MITIVIVFFFAQSKDFQLCDERFRYRLVVDRAEFRAAKNLNIFHTIIGEKSAFKSD